MRPRTSTSAGQRQRAAEVAPVAPAAAACAAAPLAAGRHASVPSHARVVGAVVGCIKRRPRRSDANGVLASAPGGAAPFTAVPDAAVPHSLAGGAHLERSQRGYSSLRRAAGRAAGRANVRAAGRAAASRRAVG